MHSPNYLHYSGQRLIWGEVRCPNHNIQNISLKNNMRSLFSSSEEIEHSTKDMVDLQMSRNYPQSSSTARQQITEEYESSKMIQKDRYHNQPPRNIKKRILSQNQISKNILQPNKLPMRSNSKNSLRARSGTVQPAINKNKWEYRNIGEKIKNKTDEELLAYLQTQYLDDIGNIGNDDNPDNTNNKDNVIHQKNSSPNLQTLYLRMKRINEAKERQLEVLQVYRDELYLIDIAKQIRNIKLQLIQYNLQKREKAETQEKRTCRISVSTLKDKAISQQKMRMRNGKLQKQIQELDFQSQICNKYLVYLSQQVEGKFRYNPELDFAIDLKQQYQVLLRNFENEIQFYQRELNETQNKNIQEINRLNKDIRSLRIMINKRQQNLKELNNKIFTTYIRKNRRSSSKKNRKESNPINSLMVTPISQAHIQLKNMHEEKDQKVIQKLNRDYSSKKRLKSLNPCSSQIKLNGIVLKQTRFIKKNKELSYQNTYEGCYPIKNKQIQGKVIKIRQLSSEEQSKYPEIQNINMKSGLKSLVFYFSKTNSKKVIFNGLMAKYSTATHSYDLGRESELIKIGLCNTSDFKYEITCRDKQLITLSLLRMNQSLQIRGFMLYFQKQGLKKDSDRPMGQKNNDGKTAHQSKYTENQSSEGRIGIESSVPSDQSQQKKKKYPTHASQKYFHKDKKNEETIQQYCLTKF